MKIDRVILNLVSQYWRDDYGIAAKRQLRWKWALRLIDVIAYAMVCSFIFTYLSHAPWNSFLFSFAFAFLSYFTIQIFGKLAEILWQRHFSVLSKIGALSGFVLAITVTWNWPFGLMVGLSLFGAFLGLASTTMFLVLVILLASFFESAIRIGAVIAYPAKRLIRKILMGRLNVAAQSRSWVAGGIPGQFSRNAEPVPSIFTDGEIHQNFHQSSFRRRRQRAFSVRNSGNAVGLSSLAFISEQAFTSVDVPIDFENLTETPCMLDLDISTSPDFLLPFEESCSSVWVNPSTGLPMLGDTPGGIDVGGNLWGESNSDHSALDDMSFSSGFEDSFSCSTDYSISDDSFGGFGSSSFDDI